MTNNLAFDFLVDKEAHTLTIKREFAATRQLVWDCYTKSELLEQWFAPKPFSAKTKSMDFSEGGHWHYAMVDPDGNEYWGYTNYVTISPIDEYTALDGFADEHGEINNDLPKAQWVVRFKDYGEHTLVETRVTYHSLEDIKKVLDMGMEVGMSMTYESLDEFLLKLNSEINEK